MIHRTLTKAETMTPQKMEIEWNNGDKETVKADKIYRTGAYFFLKEYDGMHITYRGELKPKYKTYETLNRENIRRYEKREDLTEETRVFTVKTLQRRSLLGFNWHDKKVLHVEEQ